MKSDIFGQYVDRIAELFRIDKSEMFSKNKRRDLVDARQLLYYLCYTRPMAIIYIQNFMKENGYVISHSTIIHSIGVVERRINEDRDYASVVTNIQKRVSL
jgi:chromosomal replication initiation ATPase DnaA